MHRFGFLLLLILLLPGRVAAEQAILSAQDIFHPVLGTQGMVASQEATATRVGLEVLKGGGNAVDAAVAVGFALAVTLPRAGNLGGGGFMLIHMAESGETLALDYREEAPVAAGRDLFLDADGKVDNQRARFSYLSAGVPGTVAGLSAAQARFGRLSLAEVLAPAIRLAEEGMPVSVALAEGLAARAERLKAWPETARVFFKADGSPYSAGEKLVQSDLAWSLKEIARDGAAAFYEGEIGQRIAADMKANDGLITESDLAAYDVVWREPVTGSYRGYAIASMPPPSSGGVHLVQILNLLESYPLGEMGAGSAATLHVMAEAMKLAYADRSQHLGDPDFWKVPQRGLTSKAYASRLRQRIDQDRALAATEIGPGDPVPYESNETTHFSVADRFGNVVSNTYTINFSYGSGIVAKGTGILLNNEMDDFSAKPGTPNAYGLIGGAANAIEPGKRPLSSMTPTLVFKDGKPWLVTGSPGGSRIITTVLQIVLNTVDHGMNVAAATAAPRMHHQWLPDELRIEPGFSRDTLRLLAEKGHRVVIKNAMGSTQSLLRIEDGWTGASDPRRPGSLTLGY